MSFASKYNRGSNPHYNIRISSPSYTSLADLFAEYGGDYVHPVCGIYINTKGKYGPQAVIAISESVLVNLPAHLLKEAEAMRDDPEATEAINAGAAGFRVYTYTSHGGRQCYSVSWVDIQ